VLPGAKMWKTDLKMVIKQNSVALHFWLTYSEPMRSPGVRRRRPLAEHVS
jgi:hypothetical protein